MAKRKRGSSSPLSMTAVAPRKQDPYKYTRDGKKQKVKGQANVPTARQKQGAIELASSVVGGPVVGKLLGKAAGKLAGRAAAAGSRAASNVGKRMTGANRRRANRAANKSKETPNTATSPTSAPMPKKPVTPRVNKPKTPKPETPKTPTSGKSTPKRVVDIVKTAAGRGTPGARSRVDQTVSKLESKLGLGKAGQRRGVSKRDQEIARNVRTGAKVGTGAGIGIAGTKLYDSIDPMPNNKKVDTAKATKNKAPFVEGYNMDMDDFDSPKPSFPKPPKAAAKPAPETDDEFYKFYGKEGTGLGDFSRKFGIKYATQKGFERDFPEHDGEQMGGRPGKSKMKTQGLNRSKRTGFSGRGAGAALRGF